MKRRKLNPPQLPPEMWAEIISRSNNDCNYSQLNIRLVCNKFNKIYNSVVTTISAHYYISKYFELFPNINTIIVNSDTIIDIIIPEKVKTIIFIDVQRPIDMLPTKIDNLIISFSEINYKCISNLLEYVLTSKPKKLTLENIDGMCNNCCPLYKTLPSEHIILSGYTLSSYNHLKIFLNSDKLLSLELHWCIIRSHENLDMDDIRNKTIRFYNTTVDWNILMNISEHNKVLYIE